MNKITVGRRVRDVYTGREGVVLSVREDGRCTVDLDAYKMTGCQTWFEVVKG